MIKKIKVKKQLNLHELIKHVWDNTLSGVYYESDCKKYELSFDAFGRMGSINCYVSEISFDTTFTVAVEEPFTEDTRLPFPFIVVSESEDRDFTHYDRIDANKTCKECKSFYKRHATGGERVNAKYMYKINEDGSIGELIWESEENE